MLLKKGSTGEDVKKLQSKLGTTSDGDFGPGTESKVKDWQKKTGLIPDGIINDTCWNILFPPLIIPASPFKLENLKGHIPDNVIIQIPNVASKFNITTVPRLSHFLSQCGHESAGFKAVSENLNYSADGLKKIFSKYFPGNLADLYARNPEKIASRVYANRMGNGDEASRDGWKYCGRGYVQLTGKNNYKAFADFIGEDIITNPDLVATKYPLASAAFFFNSNNLWTICDKGVSVDVATTLTKRVNGGTIGLEDRIKHLNEYFGLLK